MTNVRFTGRLCSVVLAALWGAFAATAQASTIYSPGGDGVAGTLSIAGDLVLQADDVLNFDLGAPGTVGGGVNDFIDVGGDLTIDASVNIYALGGFNPGTYRLFNYSGTLIDHGMGVNTVPSSTYTYAIDLSTPHFVDLTVTFTSPWIPGDTNEDGWLNGDDVNYIVANLTDGNRVHGPMPYKASCDVDGDGVVTGIGGGGIHPGFSLTGLVFGTDVDYELNNCFHTCRGDFDLDRKVTFSDFQIMLDHWLTVAPYTSGDANCDGIIDFSDFQGMLDNWNPAGWAESPVPEPTTLALLAFGALAMRRKI